MQHSSSIHIDCTSKHGHPIGTWTTMPVAEGACSAPIALAVQAREFPSDPALRILWITLACIKELTKLTFCSWMCLSLRTWTGKGPARETTLVLSCALKSSDRVGHVGVVSILENTCFRQYITVEIRCQAFSNSWCPIWNFSTFEDFESSLADGVSFSSKYFGFFL